MPVGRAGKVSTSLGLPVLCGTGINKAKELRKRKTNPPVAVDTAHSVVHRTVQRTDAQI